MFENAPIISRYTRAQAIADGTLIDLTTMAARVGFRLPMAITPAALAEVKELSGEAAHSDAARRALAIAEVLLELKKAIAETPDGDRVAFKAHGKVELYAVCGPGDTPEPVVTVMLVGED